jgi:hypothetical protein
MPTTALTKITAPGRYPSAWTDLTFTAGDAVNGNHFVSTGKEFIIVRNNHATLARTVTIAGSADPFNRTASIVKSVAALGYAMFGPVPASYWANASGQIVLTPETTDIQFAIITLP